MDRGQIKNQQSLIGGGEEESWRSGRVPLREAGGFAGGGEGNEHGGSGSPAAGKRSAGERMRTSAACR
jgi:hypothetical protein